jgi:hypothetical protein
VAVSDRPQDRVQSYRGCTTAPRPRRESRRGQLTARAACSTIRACSIAASRASSAGTGAHLHAAGTGAFANNWNGGGGHRRMFE